jgi:hypothetical protein
MKNFSAKNAEFETLKINNEAAITSADIGTAPNKIPLNKDLGSLAYQDAVNLDDVSADMIELRAIAAEISDSAVNVFVYDTSRDSDGGEWRKRTQNTSWYNEELNTATRGARREFPAVAMIVTEANRVAIYDGDDPDLGMWMVLESGGTFGSGDAQLIGNSTVDQVASIMFNGALVTCNSDSYHSLLVVNFLSETSQAFRHIGNYIIPHNIAERHVRDLGVPTFSGNAIVHSTINDVAMTVLPNAPIDNETGLPVPTIAVATDGGVSVIRDDGTVVDYTCTYNSNNKYSLINFIGDSKLLACSRDGETYPTVFDIPSQDKASFDSTDIVFTANPSDSSSAADISVGNYSEYKASAVTKEHIAMGGTSLIISNIDNVSGNQTADNVIISSSYNTGWMPGDIKLAALSDSVVENVGVSSDELVVNSDFIDTNNDGADNWTLRNDVTTSTSGTTVTITNGAVNFGYIFQAISTEIGKKYKFTVDVDYTGHNGRVLLGKNDTSSSGETYFKEENIGSDKTIQYYFTATTEAVSVRIGLTNSSINDSIQYSNISLVETTELITNGDFSNGDDGSWSDYSIVNLTSSEVSTEQSYLGNNSWKFITSLANSGISQNHGVFTEEGKVYTLSGYVYSSTGKLRLRWRNGNDTGYIVDNYELVSGTPNTWLAFSVTAKETGSGAQGGIRIVANAAGTFYVDGLSVRPAEEDRSVNGNGLQIFGEIQKTPVAPGADLVAYSGFSANNYLVQPYNADLDFGTGDFCVMGWFNTQQTSSNAYDDLLSIGDIGAVGYGAWSEGGLLIQNRTDNNKFLSYLSDPSGQANVSLTQPYYTPNAWNHFVIKREAGLVSLFLNGVQEAAPVEYYYNFARNNNPNWKFTIGYSGDNYVYPANNSKLALFRISATAPNSEQIAKIYHDEKSLFQDGAQATLYGTSDAVTALAYDDSEQLLHVGTASGRSDFRGLARVNNTTTAISNSISAAEGTIIQN